LWGKEGRGWEEARLGGKGRVAMAPRAVAVAAWPLASMGGGRGRHVDPRRPLGRGGRGGEGMREVSTGRQGRKDRREVRGSGERELASKRTDEGDKYSGERELTSRCKTNRW